MESKINGNTKINKHITEEDVKLITKAYTFRNSTEYVIEDYIVKNASDKMLGFLGDYWKLKVYISSSKNGQQTLHFFIKAVPKNNEAKAAMVRDFEVFQMEIAFYTDVKVKLNGIPGIKPWSPKIVATIDDAMVFEDLDAMGYKINDKYRRLDVAHTLQGLGTLARLHASSIIFEEKKKSELKKPYCLIDDCKALLRDGGYVETYPWFMQCQKGGLEAIKAYSKYSQEEVLQGIESTWANVWNTALQISGCSTEHRNVVCHRDLWNNNIFFSYKEVSGTLEPDDCVLVDFQATKYQPPTCDVMLFLYCNLERNLREENMGAFLNFYYNELGAILMEHNVAISDVIPKESFMTSAEQQRQWGLIAYACLMPTIFTNDEIATRIFTDTKQFDHIMNEDKGSFMKARMKEDMHYRNIVLETLEEIIERYCLRM